MNAIHVVHETDRDIPGVQWERIHKEVARALATATLAPVSAVFVSEERIRALNKKYRGEDRVTNVLSFSETRDILFSPSVIIREAHEQRVAPEQWCTYLCIHGILHCEGFTHNNADDTRAMEEVEVRILKQLI